MSKNKKEDTAKLIFIPNDLLKDLNNMAKKENRSLSNLIITILKEKTDKTKV